MQASAPCPAVLVLSSSVWCCWAWLPARPVSAVSLAPRGQLCPGVRVGQKHPPGCWHWCCGAVALGGTGRLSSEPGPGPFPNSQLNPERGELGGARLNPRTADVLKFALHISLCRWLLKQSQSYDILRRLLNNAVVLLRRAPETCQQLYHTMGGRGRG